MQTRLASLLARATNVFRHTLTEASSENSEDGAHARRARRMVEDARRAKRLRDEEIRRLIDEGAIGELSGRSDLSAEMQRAIEAACLQSIADGRYVTDEAILARADLAAGALADLYRGGLLPSAETRRLLLDLARSIRAVLSEYGSIDHEAQAAHAPAFRALLSLPDLTPEEVGELLGAANRVPALLAGLTAHPSASLGLWRHVAYTRMPDVEERLVQIPAALADGPVRSQLLYASSIAVLKVMLEVGTDEERRKCVEALLRYRPENALELIEARNPYVLRVLGPADMEPLLAHYNSDVRLRAIQALPLLRAKDAPTLPEPVTPAAEALERKPARSR